MTAQPMQVTISSVSFPVSVSLYSMKSMVRFETAISVSVTIAITHSLLVEWKIINKKGMRGRRAIVSFGDDRDPSRARQSYGRTGLVQATGNSNL